MTRYVVLDTETTGLNPNDGHRIIEIGCVEVLDGRITGNQLQLYINPERDIPFASTRIHGITEAMVRDKPVFKNIANTLMDFIGNATLIMHNASFDMAFLNHHLKLVGFKNINAASVIDTLPIARSRYHGAPASLDALCKRFNIDLRGRIKHGALVDARLLALVYIEMEYNSNRSLIVDCDGVGAKEAESLRLQVDRRYKIYRITTEEEELYIDFLRRHRL